MALRKHRFHPDQNLNTANFPVVRCELDTSRLMTPRGVEESMRAVFELSALLIASSGAITEVPVGGGVAGTAELHLRTTSLSYDSPSVAMSSFYLRHLSVQSFSYQNPVSAEVLAVSSPVGAKGLSGLIRALATLRSEMRIKKAEADSKELESGLKRELLEEAAEREVIATERARAEVEGMELDNELRREDLAEKKRRRIAEENADRLRLARLIIEAQKLAAESEGSDVVPWSLPFAMTIAARAQSAGVVGLIFDKGVNISVVGNGGGGAAA